MKYFLLLAASLSLSFLSAQSLDRQVISSTGGYTATGNVTVSSTVGEAVIQTAISGSMILTQGFQQPDANIAISIDDPLEVSLSYNIYPNPTSDRVTVELTSTEPLAVGVKIYDIGGKYTGIHTGRIDVMGTQEVTLDLTGLAEGVYLLTLKNEEGEGQKSFRIQVLD